MKAIIAGGGIAGAACAIALRKAGIEADIFEAFDRGAEGVGAFLTVAVNGLRALRAIDVDTAALGFETPRIALYLADGQPLADFDLGSAGGLRARTVRRDDLYRRLRDEALHRGAGLHYGKKLADACDTGRAVQARFADGSSAEGDVLIGADGLHSVTRRIIDAGAPQARYVGLLNLGGFARGVPITGAAGTMHMFFGRRCFFAYTPAPDGTVWWFANPGQRREPRPGELAGDDWRGRLLELMDSDATPACDLIRATPPLPAPWATCDFPHVPHWRRGRMVIVGDAAHAASPSSGQGASMAIEDAVALARCLRDGPSVEQALAQYETLRRSRAEAVVAQGRRNGSGKTPPRFLRPVRDVMLRFVFRDGGAGVEQGMRWVYDHPTEWEA
ncbi:MAG: NAD(P)/FAD-dependent oxidoreductase [Pseudomonadota bacterium]